MSEYFDVSELARATVATLNFQDLSFEPAVTASASSHDGSHRGTTISTTDEALQSSLVLDLPRASSKEEEEEEEAGAMLATAVVFWVEYDVGGPLGSGGTSFATGPAERGFRQLVHFLPPPGSSASAASAQPPAPPSAPTPTNSAQQQVAVAVDFSGGLVQVGAAWQ